MKINKWSESIKTAETLWENGNMRPPGYPSSDYHDAVLVALHVIYKTGAPPKEIKKSRGYTWTVEYRDGQRRMLKITNWNNPKTGIVEGGIK